VPSTPKHSNNNYTKVKKGVPRRRHSLPDNAKLPDNVKLNYSRTPRKQPADPPRPQYSTAPQPIKQSPRRRRHTLSGNTVERPDISCIQSFIRQANIHEEDYYHHLPKNKLAVVNNESYEFERVDQTHSRAVETDHNQSSTSNNNNHSNNNNMKSQVKRIITERRRRHSMPDNKRAPNPSDLLMSLPLPANHHCKGLDKQCTAKRLDHTSSTPSPDKYKNENNNENEKKYRYKVGQTLQDATSHSHNLHPNHRQLNYYLNYH